MTHKTACFGRFGAKKMPRFVTFSPRNHVVRTAEQPGDVLRKTADEPVITPNSLICAQNRGSNE
jgi:hypothetical protein